MAISWPTLFQGDPLGVIKWARDLVKKLRELESNTGKGEKGDTGPQGPPGESDWIYNFKTLVGNANYQLDHEDIGVVNVEYANIGANTYTVTLPTPVEGEWFQIHISNQGGGSGHLILACPVAGTLMDWTGGGPAWPAPTNSRWLQCTVLDYYGTLMWGIVALRTWTGSIPAI